MAADVKAPRIVRETTNMERAAQAARDRRAASGCGNRVSPDLIDNALADLEIARIFLDATDNYFDELNEWLRPDGCTPNRALHEEVHKAQTVMREADDRLTLAEGRLRTSLDQAYSAQVGFPTVIDGVRFDTVLAAYRDAWNRGVATYLLNFPGLITQDRPASDEYHAFEDLMDPLYSAARDAAVDVLLAPAATVADLLLKQEIIDQQEMEQASDGELIGKIMAQLIADGAALAGGAA